MISVIRSDFAKVLKLALLLRERGIDVELWFDQRSHNLAQSLEEAQRLGFVCHGANKTTGKAAKRCSSSPSRRSGWMKLPIFCKRLWSEVAGCLRIIHKFGEVLVSRDIALVIFPVASAGYNVPIYTTVCNRCHVPTLCIPFAVGDRDALAKAIQRSPKSAPDYLLNAWFLPLCQRWSLALGDKKYLVLPAETIIAYAIMRVEMTYPLSFYGADVGVLLLDSEYMLHHANRQQIAAFTVAITGGMFDDDIATAWQERTTRYQSLCRAYGWDKSRRLICLALPPLGEAFETFRVFVDKFLPPELDLSSWNVLVGLHPRIAATKALEMKWPQNIRCTKDPIELLLPMSAAFVATYSSTIRTSVALGIPVINYDLLNFNYDIFKEVPGVRRVASESEYLEVLQDFADQGPEYRRLREAIEKPEVGATYSMLDGDAERRIVGEIINAAFSSGKVVRCGESCNATSLS